LLGVVFALGVIGFGWLAVQLCRPMPARLSAAARRAAVAGRRWWRGRNTPIAAGEIEGIIRCHPLLGRLEPGVQASLAALLRPQFFRPWQTIAGFDAAPGFVGLVLSGRATLYRRLPSGRKARFLSLIEHDLFGAHDLVDAHERVLEVRSATPVVVLTISREDFQRLVIGPLGAPTVASYLDKYLFLQRASAMCAEWPPVALLRFAELAGIAGAKSSAKSACCKAARRPRTSK
jgi:hypothetical protein